MLAVRPVQIDPYWQHGGHAAINSIAVDGRQVQRQRPALRRILARTRLGRRRRLRQWRCRQTHREGTPKDRAEPSLRFGLLSAACEFAFSLAPGASVASSSRRRCETALSRRRRRRSTSLRETVDAELAGEDRPAQDHGRRPGGQRHGRGADGVHPRQFDANSPSSPVRAITTAPGFATARRRPSLCSGPASIEEAKAYVLWYAKRIYENGMVPPILNVDGTVNRGYGSNIEFDAQGEFVGHRRRRLSHQPRPRLSQRDFRARRPRDAVHRGALRANQRRARARDALPWPLGSIHQPRGL